MNPLEKIQTILNFPYQDNSEITLIEQFKLRILSSIWDFFQAYPCVHRLDLFFNLNSNPLMIKVNTVSMTLPSSKDLKEEIHIYEQRCLYNLNDKNFKEQIIEHGTQKISLQDVRNACNEKFNFLHDDLNLSKMVAFNMNTNYPLIFYNPHDEKRSHLFWEFTHDLLGTDLLTKLNYLELKNKIEKKVKNHEIHKKNKI